MFFAVSYILHQATHRQSCDALCSTALAMLAGITDGASAHKTHALTNLERYFATHYLYYLSYQRAKACARWRETNNRARGVDVGTRLCNERAERLQRAVSARWSTLQGRHMSKTWFLSCGVSDTGKGTFNEIRYATVRVQTISAARRQAKFPLEQANIFGCPATASSRGRASAGSLQKEHALWMCQGPALKHEALCPRMLMGGAANLSAISNASVIAEFVRDL